jgi:peptidoglycan/xylan/chitin deacetylase (PgdA/CDA1 family)
MLFIACTVGVPTSENVGATSQPLSNIGPEDGCDPTGSCYSGLLGGPWADIPLPPMTLALTIDDGPGDFGAGISSYLAGLAVPIQAAFFDNGNRFATSTDLPNTNNIDVTPGADAIVQQILAQGHIIGNHTVTHRDMATEVLPLGPTQVFNELAETDADLAGYFPSGFYLFRSPYGDFNPDDYSALATTSMNKYVGPVYWDIGGVSTNYPSQAADWACWQGQITCGSVDAALGCPSIGALAYGTGYLTTKQCGDAYLKDIATFGSGIILTHDPYSWANGNTLAMLKYIIPTLQAEGYTFIRVDDVPEVRAQLPPCDSSCTSCTGVHANQCRACAGGRYLSGTSCPLCDTCTGGTYEAAACTPTADVQCNACDASCATCGAAGPSACTSCPVGSFLTGGTCQACAVCAAGSIQTATCTATTDTTCATCSPGSYSATAGALACVLCAPGMFASDPGSLGCLACAPGTQAAGPGESACTTCAAGQVAGGGAATCSTCAPGSFAPSDSAACQPCAPGTFAAAGAGACTACNAGTFAGSSAGSCTACPPGSTAVSPGMSACSPCAAGNSAVGPGATSCAPCASGTYAATGATSCTACGTCDDGDACTVDACDPTAGCTHAPIPMCIEDAGARDGGHSAMDAGGGTTAPKDAGHDGVRDATRAPTDAARDATTDASHMATSSSGDASGPGAMGQTGGCTVGPVAPIDGGFMVCGAFVLVLRRRRRASAASSGT